MWPFSKKKEEKPAEKPKLKRSYEAANRGRLVADWVGGGHNPNNDITHGLDLIRSAARERYQNDDYIKRFILLCKDKVVGPDGVTVKSRLMDQEGKPDLEKNNELKNVWDDFCRKENCDFFSQQSFVEIQKSIVGSVVMDGEAFIIFENSGKYNFSIRMIDPNMIATDYQRTLPNGNYIKNGIEFDQFGRVTAYYFRSPSSLPIYDQYYSYSFQRIEKVRVLHIFVKEFINQTRGVPWVVTSLKRLKILDGYEEAALVAARVGASKMGFISSPGEDQTPPDVYEENGEQITEVEPGMIGQLPNGQVFTPFNPDYPHAQYGSFVKSCLRGVAAGLGVNYTTFTGDLEATSYSSIRSGTLEERDVWKGMQSFLISSFIRPVYEKWLVSALSWGFIQNASLYDLEDYKKVVYWPRRWPWVDPLKEMEGEKLAIELGVKSRSAVIRDMGLDPLTVWEEIALEQKIFEELDIDEIIYPEANQSNPKTSSNSTQSDTNQEDDSAEDTSQSNDTKEQDDPSNLSEVA